MPLYNSNFLATFTVTNPQQLSRPGYTEQPNTKTFMDPDRVHRSEKFTVTFYRTILCAFLISTLFSCKKSDKWIEVDPAFSRYIDAYTTGVISKTSSISIQLAADVNTTHSVGEEVKENLFEFSPDVKGKAYWLNARTIEFKPDGWLETGKIYTY